MIKNAARYPRLAAMMTAFGVICGVATHMSYCVAGLAVVITTTPWLFNLLKYAGAVYLVWIGIQALLSRGGGKMNVSNLPQQRVSLKSAFAQGYLCNLLNPKATLFFLAVFTQVLQIHSGLGQAVVRGDYSRPVGHLVAAAGVPDPERAGAPRAGKDAEDRRQIAGRHVDRLRHQGRAELSKGAPSRRPCGYPLASTTSSSGALPSMLPRQPVCCTRANRF